MFPFTGDATAVLQVQYEPHMPELVRNGLAGYREMPHHLRDEVAELTGPVAYNDANREALQRQMAALQQQVTVLNLMLQSDGGVKSGSSDVLYSRYLRERERDRQLD